MKKLKLEPTDISILKLNELLREINNLREIQKIRKLKSSEEINFDIILKQALVMRIKG